MLKEVVHLTDPRARWNIPDTWEIHVAKPSVFALL